WGVLGAVVAGRSVVTPPWKHTALAVLPSGVTAIPTCSMPARIGLPGVLVAVLMGVTVREPPAKASFPSGAIAIARRSMPTRICLPGLLVAVLTRTRASTGAMG